MSPKDKCSEYGHEYRHLESKVRHPSRGMKTSYKRTDQFYCVRCLDFQVVIREEESDQQPEWY